jgi:hypothetical protein
MTKRNRNIKHIFRMLQIGTNIMANQVKTPIQNYFEKVWYGNLAFEIPPMWFFRVEWKKIVTNPCGFILVFIEKLGCIKMCKIRWFCVEKVRIEALKEKIFNFNEITKITEYTRVPVTMITYQLSGYGRVIVLTSTYI